MLKYFTNSFKGNASDSIAINPRYVVSVFETIKTNQETNDIQQVNTIYANNGVAWEVEEDYLTVVSRLNERD